MSSQSGGTAPSTALYHLTPHRDPPPPSPPTDAAVKLNANRHVTGVLRGFDQFMNLVLDGAVDEKLKADIGMVVVRGNSIVTIEALEKIDPPAVQM